MTQTLADKSPEELLQVGETICRGRDWRWAAFWAYNIHRMFRQRLQPRKVWDDLDALLRVECDWHMARDLFDQMRQVTLSIESAHRESAEYVYVMLGEVVAKCLANASWSPGLFDFNAPWRVPALAFQIARHLGDSSRTDFLEHHFRSLAYNRYADRPQRG